MYSEPVGVKKCGPELKETKLLFVIPNIIILLPRKKNRYFIVHVLMAVVYPRGWNQCIKCWYPFDCISSNPNSTPSWSVQFCTITFFFFLEKGITFLMQLHSLESVKILTICYCIQFVLSLLHWLCWKCAAGQWSTMEVGGKWMK